MKIAGLLKLKNRLAGEMTRLQELLHHENVVTDDNQRSFDVAALYQEYLQTSRRLAEVKTKLAVANTSIHGKIFELAEMKGLVSMLKALDTRQGRFTVGRGEERTEVTYTPVLDKVFVNKEILRLTEAIEAIQEELDEFNHTALVD